MSPVRPYLELAVIGNYGASARADGVGRVVWMRLSRIANRLGLPDRERHWRGVAGGMRELILQRACNENRGAFVASFDDDDLDSSVLLMPELGLLRHRDSAGLPSEHIAPVTGERWRSFPQTCSPAGVSNSALCLSRTWAATL